MTTIEQACAYLCCMLHTPIRLCDAEEGKCIIDMITAGQEDP